MTNSNVPVSIVIPVYNVEKYVGKTIESVQSQDFPQYEIILVDDGSVDKSGEICDEYASVDERIRVIHQKNAGVMAARFAGVEAANGKYIAFLDGDDQMPPTAISAFYKAITENDVDYVNGYSYNIDINGNALSSIEGTGFNDIIGNNREYRSFIARNPKGMNLKMYRKDLLLMEPRIKIDPRIKNNEDFIFNLFLSSKINKVMSIPDVVVKIVKREGSASMQKYGSDYWTYVLSWLDANYKKYDVYDADLIRYKLPIVLYKLIHEGNDVDFSLACFDNIRGSKYKKENGILNLAIFAVKHPSNLLFRLLSFHPKQFFRQLFKK